MEWRSILLKVCVMGLGEVGLPTAVYLIRENVEVWGYDIDPAAVVRAKKAGLYETTRDWTQVPSMDVYIVCASTRINADEQPDLTPVFDCCKKISQVAQESSLVSIESTIVPFTSKKIYEEIFKNKYSLIHVPHRFYGLEPMDHGVRQMRVMGGVNEYSLNKGKEFYESYNIPLHIVPSIEIAEFSKIAENAYRFVQISFAEELKMICNSLSVDFERVREACNTKWNIDLLKAKDGIGGHCLPKDIRYLLSLGGNVTLLRNAIKTDEIYRNHIKK